MAIAVIGSWRRRLTRSGTYTQANSTRQDETMSWWPQPDEAGSRPTDAVLCVCARSAGRLLQPGTFGPGFAPGLTLTLTLAAAVTESDRLRPASVPSDVGGCVQRRHQISGP